MSISKEFEKADKALNPSLQSPLQKAIRLMEDALANPNKIESKMIFREGHGHFVEFCNPHDADHSAIWSALNGKAAETFGAYYALKRAEAAYGPTPLDSQLNDAVKIAHFALSCKIMEDALENPNKIKGLRLFIKGHDAFLRYCDPRDAGDCAIWSALNGKAAEAFGAVYALGRAKEAYDRAPSDTPLEDAAQTAQFALSCKVMEEELANPNKAEGQQFFIEGHDAFLTSYDPRGAGACAIWRRNILSAATNFSNEFAASLALEAVSETSYGTALRIESAKLLLLLECKADALVRNNPSSRNSDRTPHP